LSVASENVRGLGLAARVRLLAGDLFGPLGSLDGGLDMIVANPPYLPSGTIPTLPAEVERFEPHLALDGGPDGLRVLRRLVPGAAPFPPPGAGWVRGWGGGGGGPPPPLRAAEVFPRTGARRDLRGVERYIEGCWGAAPAQVSLTGAATQ